jgi:predicted amidohydrolase YtcJ
LKGFVIISILFFSLALTLQTNSRREMADVVLLNGTVWTANPDKPWAEAVALKGYKILEAGSSQEIKEMIGDSTQVIELKGDLILPGFIDSHTHFLDGGFSLLSVRLKDAESREEFISRIANRAKEIGKGAWILEGDWDHQSFDPPELPRKEWIDSVTPHNPVCVGRHDGHMVLANSLALKLAGVTKDTSWPPGGEITKDHDTGEPTGILKDAAMDLVMKYIPEPSFKEKLKAAEVALKHAAEAGVTSIHDMAYADNFEVYQELLRLNKLTARLYVYIQITEIDIFDRLKLKAPFGNNLLKIGGLKGFVPEGIMEKRLMRAEKAGLQVAIHAIGDRANNILLDIFKKIISQNEDRDRRWRIEHSQHLLPQDIERIAKLGIIASVQPYHAIDDGRWAEKKIGKKRCQHAYAFKSLQEKGAVLACGSDWTVAPLDPVGGIYAAVTRRTLDGKNPQGWFPEQKISLEEAVKGYTINGAYAEFSGSLKGSIEKGKLAVLVVLSRNIFKIPPEEIHKTEVKMTIFNGRVIFNK